MPGTRKESGVHWRKELEDLVASAKTPEDRKATEAFAQAIGPYLDDPSLLRTLLGKIQAPIPSDAVAIVVAQRSFASLDEVKKRVSDEVNVTMVSL
jgi:hypothetical protein